MNWFVNENTCFPPLASIYAFYRVHLAPLSTPPFPSLFPTLSLSRSILHSPSFRPSLRGASSSLLPLYLSHAFTPRHPSRQSPPSRPSLVPSLSPMSAIVSVYRVHIIVMTLRRYGDLRRGKGEGVEERKIAETCVRNCLRLDRCGFPSEL